jgi:hypothetical protein
VDDNIDTRLGLSQKNAHVVDSLFNASHAGWGFGVILALIFSLAGTIALARSIQRLYQEIVGHPDVGWHNVLRCLSWALAAAFEVYFDAVVSRPLVTGHRCGLENAPGHRRRASGGTLEAHVTLGIGLALRPSRILPSLDEALTVRGVVDDTLSWSRSSTSAFVGLI